MDGRGGPLSQWKTKVHENAYILHYAYASYKDVARRKHSCSLINEAKTVRDPKATPSERKAASDAIHTCFVLNFDERAFVVSVTDDEEEMKKFFRHNLLMRNGSEIERCRRAGREFPCWVKDVSQLINTAIQAGVMRRFMSPALLMGMFDRVAHSLISLDTDYADFDSEIVEAFILSVL